MEFPSLSQILETLNQAGFSDHIYMQDGSLFHNGKPLNNPEHWHHCHWFDEVSDERISICCCIAGNIKGVFIH